MYIPAVFDRSNDTDLAMQIMLENPFASMINTQSDGQVIMSHIPIHATQQGDQILLHGHLAKPNPHSKLLLEGTQTMVAFMGPHAYMSPNVYPDLARVPTWNYVAVHAYATVQRIDDAEGKDAILKKLIGIHEASYAEQWRGLDTDFQNQLLNGIVAFNLKVHAVECKVKLNQHRKESHAAMYAAYCNSPDESTRKLGTWMQRIGLVE